MAPAFTYILPAMHLVCNLVAPNAPGFNVTSTDSDLAVTESTPQDHSAPLPDGYVAYPDIGAAYKVVDAQVTWKEARKRCFDEGAQLAVIDTHQKINYIKNKTSPVDNIYVGIHRLGEEWVSIINGAALESIPWASGEPMAGDTYDCVMVGTDFHGLHNRRCTSYEKDYVCELPIPKGTGNARIAIN